jgi:hypothetical protein
MATKLNKNTVESIQFTINKLYQSYQLEKDQLTNLENEVENSDLPNFDYDELSKYGLDSELGIKLFFLGIYNLFIYGSMRESTSPDMVRFTIRKFTWFKNLFSFMKNFTDKQVDNLFSLIKVPSNIGKDLVVKSPPAENTETLKSILHHSVWDEIEDGSTKKEDIVEVQNNEDINDFRNKTQAIADSIHEKYLATDDTAVSEDESLFKNRNKYKPIYTRHTKHLLEKEELNQDHITKLDVNEWTGKKVIRISRNTDVFNSNNICKEPATGHPLNNIQSLEILDTPYVSDMENEEWNSYINQLKTNTNLRINDESKLYKILDKIDKSEMFTTNEWITGWEYESKKNLLYAATLNCVEDLLLRRAWSFLSKFKPDIDNTYEESASKLREKINPLSYNLKFDKLRYRNWLFTGYPIGLDEQPDNKIINKMLTKKNKSLKPSNLSPFHRPSDYDYSGLAYSLENKKDQLTYYNGLGTYGFHSLLDKKEDNRSIKDCIEGSKNPEIYSDQYNYINKEKGYNHPHYHVLKELLMMLTPYDGENTYDLVKDYAKKLDSKQISIEDFMEICLQRKFYQAFKEYQIVQKDENQIELIKDFLCKYDLMPITGSIDYIPAIEYINRFQSQKGWVMPITPAITNTKILEQLVDQDTENEYKATIVCPLEDLSEFIQDYKLADSLRNEVLNKMNSISTLPPRD